MKTTTTKRGGRPSRAERMLAALNMALMLKDSAFRASGDLQNVTFTAGGIPRT